MSLLMPCDVEDIASVDAVFDAVKQHWGTMDFLVHAVAYSDKNELKGRYANSTRENFIRTMVISCYAFTEAAKRAAALMPNGGAMVTLTYNGGERAMPNYNVMGVAKAGLEASVRYLAVDFGQQKIRVNAISAGPIRTLAGAGITDARYMFAFQQKYSPLGRGVTLEELGGAGLYLLSDLSTGVTGEVHFVDRATTSSPCRSPRRSRTRAAKWRTAGSSYPLSSPRKRGPSTFDAHHSIRLRGSGVCRMAQIKQNGRGSPAVSLCRRSISGRVHQLRCRRDRSGRRSSPWSRPPRSP